MIKGYIYEFGFALPGGTDYNLADNEILRNFIYRIKSELMMISGIYKGKREHE